MYNNNNSNTFDKNKVNKDNLELMVNVLKHTVPKLQLEGIIDSKIYTQQLTDNTVDFFNFEGGVPPHTKQVPVTQVVQVRKKKEITVAEYFKTPPNPTSLETKPPVFTIPIVISHNTGFQFNTAKQYFLDKTEYLVVDNLTHNDQFLESILFSVSALFRAIPYAERKVYMADFKKKIAYEMEEHQFYKKFKYGKLRIKETDITGSLLDDSIINIAAKKYILDYLNINLLIVSNKNTYLFYEYSKDKKTVVFHQDKEGIYPITDRKNEILLVNDLFIQEMVTNKTLVLKYMRDIQYTALKKITDYKLVELQQICLKLDIPIKKIGKKKQVNRKKQELYADIENHEE